MTGGGLATHEVWLAVEPEDVTAGGAGFLVIAALGVGTAILLRSLNKHLKKVDFEEEPAPGEAMDEDAPFQEEGSAEGDTSAVGDESEEGPKAPPG